MTETMIRGDVPVPLPTTRDGLFDPPARLADFREHEPVRRLRYPDGHVGWLVTSYALGRDVLADARFGKHIDDPQMHDDPGFATVLDRLKEQGDPSVHAYRVGNFIQMDAPEHTRIRRLLAGHFTVRSMRETLEQHMAHVVEDALDEMEQTEPPLDLVEHFAVPVPLLTICHLLGVPAEERATVLAFANATLGHTHDPEAIARSIQGAGELIRGLLREKAVRPAGDLLSALAGGELTEDEIVGIGMIVAGAGYHTTSTMLAHGSLALLADRSRWEYVVAHPEGMERAVEELLRYLTIPQLDAHTRTALEDVEIDGVTIAAGERVHVSLPAANRDPERFEDPDTLDLEREARGHLSFGHGIHMCLGQHLSRLELRVAFTGLARRFPTLRLAVPAEEVPMAPGTAPLYGPYALPVAW